MKEFRLVAFGDSLTYGYGVLSHIAYPFRLARELPEKNPQLRWKVYNRGINGETTREAKERLESQVLWLKPHLTVILLGSNDSALNEGQYRTPWEYEHNMMFILERLLAEKHGDSAFHSGVCRPFWLRRRPWWIRISTPSPQPTALKNMGKSSKSWQRAIIVPSLMYIRHFWTLRKHKASKRMMHCFSSMACIGATQAMMCSMPFWKRKFWL